MPFELFYDVKKCQTVFLPLLPYMCQVLFPKENKKQNKKTEYLPWHNESAPVQLQPNHLHEMQKLVVVLHVPILLLQRQYLTPDPIDVHPQFCWQPTSGQRINDDD